MSEKAMFDLACGLLKKWNSYSEVVGSQRQWALFSLGTAYVLRPVMAKPGRRAAGVSHRAIE